MQAENLSKMNFDNLESENIVLGIIKDKFRHDEDVKSVSLKKINKE